VNLPAGTLEQLHAGLPDGRLGEGRERVGEKHDLTARRWPDRRGAPGEPADQGFSLETREWPLSSDTQAGVQCAAHDGHAPGRIGERGECRAHAVE